MRRLLALSVALSLASLLGMQARADEPPAEEPHGAEPDVAPALAPAAPLVTPAGLLTTADAAVDAGDLELARSVFETLTAQFPGTPEAGEARRALRIIAARVPPAPAPAPPPAAAVESPEDSDVVVRDEPYSRKTSERLRLTTWEKLDFGVTSFLYGMSVGFSFALSRDADSASEVLTPVALGAVAYTLGSVAFLNLAHPDRGDLPLTLAITSYLPTTTLLLMSAIDAEVDVQDGENMATATVVTGLLSIPLAVVAARRLTLDPGDTQLVRDAGFWGLALSTIGTLGFGGSTYSTPYYNDYDPPSGRKVAIAGLVGLYGGLGLGMLGAKASEVSLERVRVTTWGGYGGAIVGLLMGAAANDGREQDIYRGAVIGGVAGLVITFLSTGSLDGIPDEAPSRLSWANRFAPTMMPVAGTDGRLHPALGLGGTL